MREALRMSPPAAGTFARRTPRSEAMICGQFVPGNTTIGVHQWSAMRTERFYKEPDQFRPERWMGDAAFASDRGEAFHPFGLGPRICVGRQYVVVSRKMHSFFFESTASEHVLIHVQPCAPRSHVDGGQAAFLLWHVNRSFELRRLAGAQGTRCSVYRFAIHRGEHSEDVAWWREMTAFHRDRLPLVGVLAFGVLDLLYLRSL